MILIHINLHIIIILVFDPEFDEYAAKKLKSKKQVNYKIFSFLFT
jgi:hypothetical protein